MPPRVGNRSRGRGVRTARLADIGRPPRDPTVAPPPLEGVADQSYLRAEKDMENLFLMVLNQRHIRLHHRLP